MRAAHVGCMDLIRQAEELLQNEEKVHKNSEKAGQNPENPHKNTEKPEFSRYPRVDSDYEGDLHL